MFRSFSDIPSGSVEVIYMDNVSNNSTIRVDMNVTVVSRLPSVLVEGTFMRVSGTSGGLPPSKARSEKDKGGSLLEEGAELR